MKTLKKLQHLILVATILIQLPSCVTSFHPLFTAENITVDDKIAGNWKSSKGDIVIQKLLDSRDKEIFNQNLSAADSIFYSKFYIINYTSNGYHYSWAGGVCYINGLEFISLSADECLDSKNKSAYPPTGYEYLNSYGFARLVWKNKHEVEVQFLNSEYIRRAVLQNMVRIKYEYDSLYNSFIITTSTDEMIEFLKKYGNDERLYNKNSIITLIRKT